MTEFVQVYRAVLPAELDDLKHLGRFRNPYGNEVKYFALTRGGTTQYATFAATVFGEGPYWLVSAHFPSRFVGWQLQVTVDRGIASLALPTNLLVELRALQFLGLL